MTTRAPTALAIGATKAKHLADAAAALDLRRTDQESASLAPPCTPRLPPYV